MIKHPKVAVVGAGSFFFGRPVIWNMTHSPVLREGTLALVDTNPATLRTMGALARRVAAAVKAPLRIELATDRRRVLRDADFVVLTFSDRNAHFRGVDTRIAARYGVRMCSSDTIGPGGIFRALREVPKALAVARDVAALAPDAWVINFVNPTTVLGIALMRFAPSVRSFAICDGLHEPYLRLNILKHVGILDSDATAVPADIEAKLDLATGGVNHFTWMWRFRHDGKDYLPVWRKRLARQAAEERREDRRASRFAGLDRDANAASKRRFNAGYALALMDVFGAYPDRIGHTKEYVPFFQGYGVTPCDPPPLALFDADERARKMAERWSETRKFAYGRKPLAEFLATGRGDHATDIIESMWGGLGKPFYVSTANRGAIPNFADDAFLELRSHLDMHGPRPQAVGEMPLGVAGLSRLVLDTHELTAEAAVQCDRGLLLRALATDPIVNNLSDAKKIMEELLVIERDALPAGWFRKRAGR